MPKKGVQRYHRGEGGPMRDGDAGQRNVEPTRGVTSGDPAGVRRVGGVKRKRGVKRFKG